MQTQDSGKNTDSARPMVIRQREREIRENTKELLSEIHRNLVMGSENLTGIVSRVKDKFLLREITWQLEEYAAHTRQAAAMLAEYQVTPYKPSFMKQIMSKGGIALNTMIDSSDSHIAEMIVRGTDMGAGQLAKIIHRLSHMGCDEEVARFGRQVVAFERNGADRVTEFQ